MPETEKQRERVEQIMRVLAETGTKDPDIKIVRRILSDNSLQWAYILYRAVEENIIKEEEADRPHPFIGDKVCVHLDRHLIAGTIVSNNNDEIIVKSNDKRTYLITHNKIEYIEILERDLRARQYAVVATRHIDEEDEEEEDEVR